MFYSSYAVLGEWLRCAVALVLGGMVACGGFWCGVYGVQQLTASTTRQRLAACRQERAVRREARRGIAALEVYLLTSGRAPST